MSGGGHERPRVLYVMGAGRSGSTTLGITLGNCAGVFYAGELDNWLPRSGVPQLQDEERLRFWSGVCEQLEDPAAATALFGTAAQHAIERSASLFRPGRWRARLRLRRPYRAVAADLYGALVRASGVGAVADTSHYPLRARELQRVAGIDLYVLFLSRDPQGVVASFNRRDIAEYSKSTIHTNVYLWVTQLLSAFVFARQPHDRRLYIAYEDFVEDPARVISRILDVAGLESSGPPDFAELNVGMPLQGNRVSRSRTMSLKPRADPVSGGSRLTSVMQWPIAKLLARLTPSTAPADRDGEAVAADRSST